MIRFHIRPNEVYDRAALVKAMGCRDSSIGREIRLGRLRSYRLFNRDYFLGADVLEWIKAAAKTAEVELETAGAE